MSIKSICGLLSALIFLAEPSWASNSRFLIAQNSDGYLVVELKNFNASEQELSFDPELSSRPATLECVGISRENLRKTLWLRQLGKADTTKISKFAPRKMLQILAESHLILKKVTSCPAGQALCFKSANGLIISAEAGKVRRALVEGADSMQSVVIENISPEAAHCIGLGGSNLGLETFAPGDYGNWCGANNTGLGKNPEPPAIDGVDAVCRDHDKCLGPSGDHKCKCDAHFLANMPKASASTPVAEAYKVASIAAIAQLPCYCSEDYNYPCCSLKGCKACSGTIKWPGRSGQCGPR